VARKRSPRSRGIKLFPKKIVLPLGKGRRLLTVHLHTDVEEARVWRPLQFQVIDGTEAATATCLARWREASGVRFGVVTAGHGVWTAGKQLNIATRTGLQPGVVLSCSDLFRDKLDVTLVGFSAATITEADLLPATPLPAVQAPLSLEETSTLIGESTTDGLEIRIKQWSGTIRAADALALHLSYAMPRPDGSTITLVNVVEAKGGTGMFVPGTSGATWATAKASKNGCPLAFTSHGSDDAAIGTHLRDAAQWLQRQGKLEDLALAWVPGQWWRV
jgi:hypothetical protein